MITEIPDVLEKSPGQCNAPGDRPAGFARVDPDHRGRPNYLKALGEGPDTHWFRDSHRVRVPGKVLTTHRCVHGCGRVRVFGTVMIKGESHMRVLGYFQRPA